MKIELAGKRDLGNLLVEPPGNIFEGTAFLAEVDLFKVFQLFSDDFLHIY